MADINYLFCAGNSMVSSVWKINIATMESEAESANYGDGVYEYADIECLTALGDYIYCGGMDDPDTHVWQIRKTDMSKVAESDDALGAIYSLTSLGSYVYCGAGTFKIWKIDPTNMSKTDESISYGGNIYALINDGTHLYCGGTSSHKKVWKLDPTDMSKVAESATYGGIIKVLATDNTHIYCAGATIRKVYKIQISDMSKVAESANFGATINALTVLGNYVYCAGLGTRKVWKIRKSDMVKVDEGAAYNSSINALANDGTYIYCGGGNIDTVWKLDPSDMSKVDELVYGETINALLVALAPPAYDYPLAPVVFPAKLSMPTLREKCRNFEESMSDVCLVVNHNTVVTRRYLQETYGDTTYPESSNLRFVLPSQQLVKLLNKDLTTKDYNAIINNFVTNISSMFTLINENNTLVKTWLDDYMPDEEGHEFTDVKMRPIVIGEDLSKTMDALFEGIIDNVTILNMNLEVLKERF